MRKIIWVLVVFFIITFLSCNKKSQSNFEKVQIGMSRNEVEKFFGESKNGTYSNKTAQISFEFYNDSVVSSTYLVKDKNSSELSILEGPASGILSFSPGQAYLEYSGATINDYELVLSESTKYIDSDNKDTPFAIAVGSLYKILGRFESYSSGLANSYKGKIIVTQVAKVFSQSELNPKDALTFAKRGKRKLDYKDYKGAISDYTQAIKIENNFASAYYSRGYALSMVGDFIKAQDDFTRAIEIMPDTLYYLGRAIAKSNLQDSNGARLDLEQAVKLGSLDAQTYLDKYFK